MEPGTRNPERQTIRLAKLTDASNILKIYAPLVEETAVTFEFEPPTIEEFRDRMKAIQERFPWLVSELGGRVAGFAYAGPHRVRPAYQWSVEVSVYVHSDLRRKGVASGLYAKLLELLRAQGYHSAFAGITLPNDASVAFHRAAGFEPVGIYKGAGYKLGKWRDAVWYQCQIGDALPNPPSPPLRPDEVMHTAVWSSVTR